MVNKRKIDSYSDNSAEKILFDAGMDNRLRIVKGRDTGDHMPSILWYLWDTRLMYLRSVADRVAYICDLSNNYDITGIT